MLMVKTLPFGKVDSSWPPEKSGFVRGPLIHQNISETPEICHSGLKSFNLPEHLGRLILGPHLISSSFIVVDRCLEKKPTQMVHRFQVGRKLV